MSAVLGQYHPTWDVTLTWGLGLVTALLFFFSVLAHELAHSIVAQARGIPVRSITLFLFGGISNIQRDPDSPKSEFLITIVGPVTSILLGFIFMLIAGTQLGTAQTIANPGQVLDELGAVGTIAILMSSVNFALGFFNLLPGFPLDGGRILRSLLWSIMDDLRRATRWASWVGQGVAWLLILSGIAMIFGATLPFFGSGIFNGLWLAFIGWFLNTASVQSYRQIVIHDLLEDVPVSRLMKDVAASIDPDISLRALVDEHIMRSDEKSFPVMENDQVIGIIALEDVRRIDREDWLTTTVRDAMTPEAELEIVSPQEDTADALRSLAQRDVRLLPVQEDGKLIGILRRQDIIKWLQFRSKAH